jgi:F420-dependent oxidoreductase-like protein
MPNPSVRFGIAHGQQNVLWNELREFCVAADQLGYDSLWTSDHFYPIAGTDVSGPHLEGWTTLTGLSQHIKNARIGALVNCVGYRNPCLTAKMAATLDHLSGGRFMLGLGAGWFELEHRSFGYPFHPIGERLRALDETCRIIKSMFTEERTTFRGRHYEVVDAMCNPKPFQRPYPPIMIAGSGEKVLLRIVAQHADMWNAQGSPERMRDLIEVMRRHGDQIGRDIDRIEKTVVIALCYHEPREREERAMRMAAALAQISPDEARKQMIIGDKQECLDTIERYVQVGVRHFLLMLSNPYSRDEIGRFADEVIAKVR